MERVQTNINGISTTSEYQDGDCISLVNLRPKNGALIPVSPRKVVNSLTDHYEIIFVHKGAHYENWIGVQNVQGSGKVTVHILEEDTNRRRTFSIPDIIVSIEQIGNTLSIITANNIYYLLYRNTTYSFLGELPELPVIEFRTGEEYTQKKFYNSFVNEGSVTKENFIEMTKAALYMARQELADDKSPVFYDSFFVRYAFRLYDNTITKHSPPILVMPPTEIVKMMWVHYRFKDGHINGLRGTNPSVSVKGFNFTISYDLSHLSAWTDIIQSVDIFISPYMAIATPENIGSHFKTSDDEKWYTDFVIEKLTSGNIASVKQNSLFYFVKSLEIGTFGRNMIFPEENADTKLMENIAQRDQMTDDNFSQHKYGANVSYVYNNRLHIADIKTTFFNGFHPGYFQWNGTYNGIEQPDRMVRQIIAEVELQTETVSGKVYSIYGVRGSVPELFTSAFISYPDARAKKMNIYMIAQNGYCYLARSLKLQPHDFLNLAYFVNDNLEPVVYPSNYPRPTNEPETGGSVSIRESNKLKVSELNNPLNFPNVNTYLVGNGSIMAMATNIMNVSDWNYGQYPLYVFTSEGIWTLNVGDGTAVYSTVTAPTYNEAPTVPVVSPTPIGVVFVTKRGLHIINGQQVNYITPHIEQDRLPINESVFDELRGMLHPLPVYNFKNYLEGLKNMFYNPYENELVIAGKREGFNYVLNLDTNLIHQSTESVDLIVRNIYPRLMGIADRKIKDFAQSYTPDTHVSFVTRPLRYGTQDIKKMERTILRGYLLKMKSTLEGVKPFAVIYCSGDGINFIPLKGLFLNNGSYKDIDLGMFACSKHRQFIFSFAGIVEDKSQINYLETMIEKEYNNSKMR